jgi:hypothetical protein
MEENKPMDKELAEAAKYAQEIELLTRAISNLVTCGIDDMGDELSVLAQRLRILLGLP